MVLEKLKQKSSIRIENFVIANKKNAADVLHLSSDISRINRESSVATRKYNRDRQKFKNKYSSLDMYTERRNIEAIDNAEFASTEPLFCKRRNGECQAKSSYIKSSSVNMQDLHLLLFTDGEVDIDKVLCLYLLTAHKTDSLRMPPKSEQIGYKARQLSPLERLISRAKKRTTIRPRVFKNLPLFILDVPIRPFKRELKRDTRLEGKIIVNTKVMRIVQSVRTALEATNAELLKRFMYIAHDRSRIENIMMQPKMEAFYKTLYGQNIISCCESFELESVPLNGSITFRVDVEPLEELVRLVRNNVLLIPNSSTWKDPPCSNETTCTELLPLDEPSDGRSFSERCLSATGTESFGTSVFHHETRDFNEFQIAPQQVESNTICELTESAQEFFLNIEKYSDAEIDKRETMIKMQPKILKNLQLGFSNMELPDDDDERQYTFDQDLPLEELAILLDQKVKEEASVDYQNMVENLLPENDSNESVQATSASPRRRAHGSFSVKQTTCMACLKRWSEPLPTPKISKIKKFKMPDIGETSYFSSKSAQRISDLIDAKVKKIELEEQSKEKASNCSRDNVSQHRQMHRSVNRSDLDQTIEIIDLDEMDLAKIRQEIRENETAKKLKRFLEEK